MWTTLLINISNLQAYPVILTMIEKTGKIKTKPYIQIYPIIFTMIEKRKIKTKTIYTNL